MQQNPESNREVKGNILIIDDDPSENKLLCEVLKNSGYAVRSASSGVSGMEQIQLRMPDLILLDIRLPDVSGYDICIRMKQTEGTEDIPIIFISALEAISDKVRAFEVGGADYMIKPIQTKELLARVDVHLTLQNLQKCLKESNKRLQREIAERREAEEELSRYRKFLEELVRERTTRLEEANALLQKEIAERKQSAAKLQAALGEKEVLLKEVHHRVKNNLQVVSGLLMLQQDNTNDPHIISALKESRNRVQSMALVHQTIYQSENVSRICLDKYLPQLAEAVKTSFEGSGENRISLNIKCEEISLSLDKAVPCGLIINELLSNSYKHAFPNGCSGEIKIQVNVFENKNVEIIVYDNGKGFPDDFETEKRNTLGIYLVTGLVETQLGGTLYLGNEQGAKVSFLFSEQ